MAKVRVPVFGSINRSVSIETELKAVFGQNIFDANGNKVSLSDLMQSGGVQQPESDAAGTSDELDEGQFNLFFTAARAVAAIAAVLAPSVNIMLTYDTDTQQLVADLTPELAETIAGKLDAAEIGQPDGAASLDAQGLVPRAQLPPIGSGVPTQVADGVTYMVPAGQQTLWAVSGELLGHGNLELDGAFVEVN